MHDITQINSPHLTNERSAVLVHGASFSVEFSRTNHFLAAKEYDAYVNWLPHCDYRIISADAKFPSKELFPPKYRKTIDEKIIFYCFRSALNYWLNYAQHQPLRRKIERLLLKLEAVGVIAIRNNSSYFKTSICVVPHLGLISETARCVLNGFATASAGFCVIFPTECRGPFQSIGDNVGLVVQRGKFLAPAIHCRPALIYDGKKHKISLLSIKDHVFELPGGIIFSAESPADRSISVRICTTPMDKHILDEYIVEYIAVGNRIVGTTKGFAGKLAATSYAFSVRDETIVRRIDAALIQSNHIKITMVDSSNIVSGIQGGPMLVSDGIITLSRDDMENECMVPSSFCDFPIPGSFYKSTGDTLAARCGIAVDSMGKLMALYIPGSSSTQGIDSGTPNDGATLDQLAAILAELGVVEAMGMDGGGSMQLYENTKCVISSADFRGSQTTRFERALPTAIVFR